MTDNRQKIELLAPAKDFQAGIAAVKCGADAVYIGAPRFSAREAAGNSLDDIRKLISFAHPYYVKVYAALNTILDDHEMLDAEKMIASLYETGIDGLIIQDTGLLELSLPPLPLIASTQMHNSTADRVKFLEDVGFSRVILARELTLDQIREIRRRTSIELECFVYGALCVSQSGQCYMSYVMGGRSGNRGQCAQPCRKLYSLSDTAGKTICPDRYLLSLRDLNLSEYIAEFLNAGVTSFKIEGRLKDAAYVVNITAYYRQLLDTILPGQKLRKSSSGSIKLDFTPDPAKTFNRSFTDYGIIGRRGKMGSIDTPKSIGEKIGQVRKVSADHFEIAGDIELHNGDGICFFDANNDLQGTAINRVDSGRVFPQKINGVAEGTIIYRNYDHKFHQLIRKIPAQRKIALSMRFYETADGIALEAKDHDGNCAAVQIPHGKAPVKNLDNARENTTTQLTKLGNTIFSCDDLKVDLAELYFFPVSVLNRLRRDLVEVMLEKRLSNRPVRKGGVLKNNTPYPQQSVDYTANVFNENARRFYQRHGVTQIAPAAETGLDLAGKLVMKTKYCVRHQLNLCPGHTVPAEPLILTNQENDRFLLKFRCSDCGMDICLIRPD